eukprot:12931506-Prorocentrum_lima.AAC.1
MVSSLGTTVGGGLAHVEHPNSSAHHAAPATTSKPVENQTLPTLKEKGKAGQHNFAATPLDQMANP